jgi:polysaccharide chain length determinant protein (PEP-CTERM system associated)
MPNISISALIKVFFRELIVWRFLVVALFGLVSFAVLIMGFFWPKQYESSASIHVDQQNIIQPLLRGSAEVTRLDQTKVARETIFARSFLLEVGQEARIQQPTEAWEDQGIVNERMVAKIRGGLTVRSRGDRLIEVSSKSSSAEEAFAIVSTVVAKFIRDSAESKRQESREAFLFIDNQVKSYKEQLTAAESRLKAFKINNQEGTEASVQMRLNSLRSNIQNLQLQIDEEKTKRKEIEAQLAKESEYLPQRYRADLYRQRLQDLRNRLSLLRLDYTETYPDVVSVKLQIESLEQAIVAGEQEPAIATTDEKKDPLTNPLFEELRLKLSETDVQIRVLTKRSLALNRLVNQEQDRLRRVATSNAELAELVRDYDVTKGIYEDMLERKEKARMSMALDIEGQGVTYRIQEPANFPLQPMGFRLLHFAMAGPILGGAIPIGLLIALILFDPRIRFADRLEEIDQVPVLGVVPHVNTPLGVRVKRGDVLGFLALTALVVGLYGAVVGARYFGLL